MGPGLIQRRAFSWTARSAEMGVPARFVQAHPVFDQLLAPLKSQRRVVVGWKAYARVHQESENPPERLYIRLDIGGQADAETDDAIPLVAFAYPYESTLSPSGAYPIDTFAAPIDFFSLSEAPHTMTYSAWPGCNGCMPVHCDDSVRCLIRGPRNDDERTYTAKVNLTLWIASD